MINLPLISPNSKKQIIQRVQFYTPLSKFQQKRLRIPTHEQKQINLERADPDNCDPILASQYINAATDESRLRSDEMVQLVPLQRQFQSQKTLEAEKRLMLEQKYQQDLQKCKTAHAVVQLRQKFNRQKEQPLERKFSQATLQPPQKQIQNLLPPKIVFQYLKSEKSKLLVLNQKRFLDLQDLETGDDQFGRSIKVKLVQLVPNLFISDSMDEVCGRIEKFLHEHEFQQQKLQPPQKNQYKQLIMLLKQFQLLKNDVQRLENSEEKQHLLKQLTQQFQTFIGQIQIHCCSSERDSLLLEKAIKNVQEQIQEQINAVLEVQQKFGKLWNEKCLKVLQLLEYLQKEVKNASNILNLVQIREQSLQIIQQIMGGL